MNGRPPVPFGLLCIPLSSEGFGLRRNHADAAGFSLTARFLQSFGTSE